MSAPQVLPSDLDWLHTFPCRFGNTASDARNGRFNGRPVPGRPFASVTGARWCSARLLADGGAPSRFRLAGQGVISQMALSLTGVVSYPSVFVVPPERLTEAIDHAELLLATASAAAGIREWTPAYGASGAQCVVGVHVHFVGVDRDPQRCAFADAVGAECIIEYEPHIPTPEDPERRRTDRCSVRDPDGTLLTEWSDGVVYLVDCDPLDDEMPELRAAAEADGAGRRSRR